RLVGQRSELRIGNNQKGQLPSWPSCTAMNFAVLKLLLAGGYPGDDAGSYFRCYSCGDAGVHARPNASRNRGVDARVNLSGSARGDEGFLGCVQAADQ